jgi:ABC-type glycerol-3-phosphate transport system permease component
MSACVIFTLPALGIFLLGQRFFLNQMTAGALK